MPTDPTPPDKPREPRSDGGVLWDRWTEVDRLLELVLDVPPGDREELVRRECPDDPAMAELVLSLAGASDHDPETRWVPAPGILRAALGEESGIELDDPNQLVGTMAGPYRLTGVLGTGGMGSVYAAERADEAFERMVAVKVLKRSVSSPSVVQRFRLERQILASLDHPSIAQLMDGGVTDDGRPFLVMELVEGQRIDDWADHQRLGVDERIRLALAVMEAVEHAHRHMVVHRDLKPGNILVRDDGSVKLLDFGIARLLDEPTGMADATKTGGRFLTPEYAAPEQLLGEPASAQSDVYSLGALLYELLTGIRPYATAAGTAMLEQVVRGGEPTAPSAALPPVPTRDTSEGAGAGASHPVFAARRTTPGALQRRLSGDLDAILVGALRARPSERYPSVAAFREDIERHLAGYAVSARGDARAYRFRRFVGRHRGTVAALSGVFLLATGSALGLAVQRGSLIEQRNLAEAARNEAAHEAETARATADFLINLFEASDPTERLGDTLTARALLERGVERIAGGLRSETAVRAELLGILGDVHMSLGLYDDGIRLHDRAIALARDSLSEPYGGELLDLAQALTLGRDLRRAPDAYREAIDIASAEGDSVTVAWARIGLGRTLGFLEEPDSAAVELRAGLALLPPLPSRSEEALIAQLTLAGIVRRQGDLETADSLYSDIVTARRAGVNQEPLALASVLNDLAVVRRLRGRHAEATVLYREAIDSLDHALGPAHARTLMIRDNLGTNLREAGEFDAALAVYRTNVRATREEWPEGHWTTAKQLMHLGAILIEAGRPEEAIPPLSESVDMAIEHIGRFHSWTNVYRAWLGTAAALTGRDEAAAQLYSWSLEGLAAYQDLPSDLDVAGMLRALIDTMRQVGLREEARPFAGLLEPGDRP